MCKIRMRMETCERLSTVGRRGVCKAGCGGTQEFRNEKTTLYIETKSTIGDKKQKKKTYLKVSADAAEADAAEATRDMTSVMI